MTESDKHINCIKEKLEAILDAQKIAQNHSCNISCENGLTEPIQNGVQKNTVPFMLHTKQCMPYKVDGVYTYICSCTNKEKFACFSTYLFRIQAINGNCANIELLTFDREETCCEVCSPSDVCSPNCQIDCEDVEDLVRTGVCVTIDLSCFSAIICLPAVTLANPC